MELAPFTCRAEDAGLFETMAYLAGGFNDSGADEQVLLRNLG